MFQLVQILPQYSYTIKYINMETTNSELYPMTISTLYEGNSSGTLYDYLLPWECSVVHSPDQVGIWAQLGRDIKWSRGTVVQSSETHWAGELLNVQSKCKHCTTA